MPLLPELTPLLPVVADVSSVVWLETDELDDKEFRLIFLCKGLAEGAALVIIGSGGGLVTDDRLRVVDLSSIKPLLLDRLLFAKEFSRLLSLLVPIPDVIVIE